MKLALGATLFAAALVPLAAHAAEYATVVSSTPVNATVNVPRRVCTDEQQLVRARPYGAGALIGAIAGGAIGNALGGGFGRAAATGLGVVAGAAIGNGVETNAANAYPPTAVPVQRCQMVSSVETRAVGYDVVYEYAGRRYTTRMARDPGAQIQIEVRPAGALAEAAAPAPEYLESPAPRAMVAPVYAPVPLVAAPPVVYIGPSVGYYYGGWGRRGYWH